MSWPNTLTLITPMTAANQASEMGEQIDTVFAKPRGGQTLVMETMWHVWEYILSAQDEPTVMVCCTGETPRGSFAEQDHWHVVDRQWTVVILRGRGFLRNLMPGADGNPPQGAETLTASIEALRDTVRKMTGISREFPINYKGWKSLPAVARPGTANVFTAGAFLEFSTACDIGEVSET